jgi:hypothetical protein
LTEVVRTSVVMPTWLLLVLLIMAAVLGFLCAVAWFGAAIAYYRTHECRQKSGASEQ